MSASGPDRLYDLLPVIYRARDPDRGQPLRALLGVVGEEYDRLRASIGALEDSWFIETCDPQVIPFIGDLVGVARADVERVPAGVRRAYVGNAVRLRRRKGVAPALERAIAYATGWTAHAVEMFEHLGVTQHVQHPRPHRGLTFDVRSAATVVPEPGVEIGGHTADVRSAGDPEQPGRFHLRTLAVFVSRLGSYPVELSQPRRVKEGCYTFHPLGLSTPLFTQPVSDDDPLRPHALTDLCTRIPPPAFAVDLATTGHQRRVEARTDQLRAALEAQVPSRWFGPGASIEVHRDGATIPPTGAVARDLSGWERPDPGLVAIDVRLGRMTLPPGEEPGDLRVSWSYGRVADIGAGPHPRRPAQAPSEAPSFRAEVGAAFPKESLGKGRYATLADAIAAWGSATGDGLVVIRDSSTYDGALTIPLGARSLRIEAQVGEVPVVSSSVDVSGNGGSLSIEGVVLGAGLVYRGTVRLSLSFCTVHGTIEERDPVAAGALTALDRKAELDLLAGARVELSLARCLVGPVRVADPTGIVEAEGSILDGGGGPAVSGAGPGAGPALSLSTSTLIGDVTAEVLLQAEGCLFTGAVRARRVQSSVLRFCAVPYASRSLPRHRSVLFGAPEGAPEAGAVPGEPRFASLDLAQPEYGRLAEGCPAEILAGAEDGGQIGALHHVHEERRRAALDAVLDDFLPHQLAATLVFIE